jgi:uncharacterized protein (TIGR02246 family)
MSKGVAIGKCVDAEQEFSSGRAAKTRAAENWRSAYSLLDVPVGRCTEKPSSNKRSPHQLKPKRERTMAQSSSTAIRDAIAAAIEKFMAAFSRGDAAGCAALYTEQGQLLPPNSDVIAGKQAIQTFWKSAMHIGITAVKLETAEMESHGNKANEVGTYILQGTGGQVLDTGNYVVIWKQEAGQWKLHRDIWNSSRPAAGQ